MRYIYLTTNLINSKRYIGQRKCPCNVSPENDNYIGSGIKLVNAIKKYGKESFSKQILHICETQKEADRLEIQFIKENRVLENKDKWYNIDSGGQYGRGENHAEIKSKSMKQFYSTNDAKDKLIQGKNQSRLKRGLILLPYTNHTEFLNYKEECRAIRRINKHIRAKIKAIKRLKAISRSAVKALPEYKHHSAVRSGLSLWANEKSVLKRRASIVKTWDERRQSGDIWTNDVKMSFSRGKLNQSNNIVGLYLIGHGVSLRMHGIQKKIKKCIRVYVNESNRIKQIDNIIHVIYTHQSIQINRDVLIHKVYESL
jgi:hypothetical protein